MTSQTRFILIFTVVGMLTLGGIVVGFYHDRIFGPAEISYDDATSAVNRGEVEAIHFTEQNATLTFKDGSRKRTPSDDDVALQKFAMGRMYSGFFGGANVKITGAVKSESTTSASNGALDYTFRFAVIGLWAATLAVVVWAVRRMTSRPASGG